MKYKTLVRKLHLSEQDFDDIKKAVADAEAKTTGEIAVAVTAESARYSFWELLAGNIAAALVLIVMIPFADKIRGLYRMLYWQNEPSWILPLFYIITCFASVIIIFYLANIPALDRLIIPPSVKRSCVTHRAFRYFTESGVYETAEHSGILIFVSYMERQVRIVADSGISAKISQDMWNLIADELAENIGKGQVKLAFTTAIEKCGALLAENFPPHQENPNELSDGLVIVEDEEWF
ncbi:MAG: TPM domain-containing protein [Treponema sp.]|nr:TPM domain-containing protein [Treponema sp.]